MPKGTRRRILNPANLLTLARVPLAFCFLACYPAGAARSGALLWLATAIALAVELTDLLDGALARRLDCVTDLGKLIDPFCDAFARQIAFWTLAATPFHGGAPLVPLWVPAVLTLRDLSVALCRTAAARAGVVLAARTSGKGKALAQGTAILATLAVAALAPAHAPQVGAWAGLLAAMVTLWSLVDYVQANRSLLARLVEADEATGASET